MQTRTYHDFDAFADDVREIDARMIFQNPTSREWSITHLNVGGIDVQLGRLGSGNIVDGASWSTGFVLYLPLTESCEYIANGTSFGTGSFWVLEPGTEFSISTRYEHDWCSILVPTALLAEGVVSDTSPNQNRVPSRVTRPDRYRAQEFLTLVRGAVEAAASSPTFEQSPAAKRAAAAIVDTISPAIAEPQLNKPRQTGRPRASRAEIIRSCGELLEERPAASVLVIELASHAKVSERTLRTAFGEYYGVSPARYLQLRRLHAVHRDLQAAEPDEESVGNVLVRHGEWDMGRFAKRYQRQFGELPSETLGVVKGRRRSQG